MRSDDGKFAIVFNGEIYNYLELKNKYLAGENFKSTGDTEVLLNLLRFRGIDTIPLLNGMFAFAFWDIENKKVILARDPAGQKPLFYHTNSKALEFVW